MQKISWKLILILLFAWALLSIRLGDQFTDFREAPHVWIPAAIRTIDIHGLDTVGLMMTRNTAPITSPDDIEFYSHHPAMMVWVPLLSTRLLGFHEAGVRFPFMVITLLTICVLYVLARRLFGQKIALWAAFFYAIAPYTTYYGRVPAPDVIGFLWAGLYAVVILNWIRHPKPRHILALCGLVWLAVWTAWTTVFFIATLGIVAMVLGTRQHRLVVIGLGGLAMIAFVALILFYQMQWDGSINSILEAYVWRSSTASLTLESQSFTMLQWVAKNIGDIVIFATGGLFFLALAGSLSLPTIRREARWIIIGLFAGSLSYQLAFLNASYVHDVDKASFTLVLAILAALGVEYLRHPRRRRWGRPLWQILLLLAMVQGLAVTLGMHATGNISELNQAIDLARTAPESAQLAVNIPQIRPEMRGAYRMVVEFYAFREILWEVDASQAHAAAGEVPVFYVTCAPQERDTGQAEAACRSELIN